MDNKKIRKSKKHRSRKPLVLLLVLTLLVGCAVGGTIAWLTAQTEEVQNTFVAGQIGDLQLNESDTDQSNTVMDSTYIVIPGVDITKDPTVKYAATTAENTVPVDAYIFVKLTQEKEANENKWAWNAAAEQYEIKNASGIVVMYFKIDSDWTKLTDADDDVFYQKVAKTDGTFTDSIIADDSITVSSVITEEDVEEIAAAADGLTFQAYAIQQAGFDTALAAWNEVSK